MLNASNFKGKELLIFDLDGTILKLNVDWISARKIFRNFLKKEFNIQIPENMRVDEMEFFLRNSFGKKALFKALELRKKIEQKGIKDSLLNKGMPSLIQSLYNQGKILTICTNNLRETAEEVLKKFKLKKYFREIVGIDSILIPKPSPKGCLEIIKKYNISKNKVLFIGDSEITDKKAAELAGIECFLVSFSKTKCL